MPVSSFSYNGINLEDYGITVVSASRDPMSHKFDSVQLEDKAYSWKSRLQPLMLSVDIFVECAFLIFPPLFFSDIHHSLRLVKEVLNQREDCQLIFSNMPETFWLARFQSLEGNLISPTHFKGTIDFLCSDPRAFWVDETVHTYAIDENPKTIQESLIGTAYVEPVYLLTAGENLPGATVTLENQTTDEELSWSGDLETNDKLEIDVALWVVRLNGIESMGNLEGIFPRMVPVINTLQVSGFGTTGTLQITYRNAYV